MQLKFLSFNNFYIFSHFLVQTRFFYKIHLCNRKQTTLKLLPAPFSLFKIPISNFYNKKDISSFWELMRTTFLCSKFFSSYPKNIFFSKQYFKFFIFLSFKKKAKFFVSFLRVFQKRNKKLFLSPYLNENLSTFSFFLRDIHLMFNFDSNIYDFYNWKNKIFFSIFFEKAFQKKLKLMFIAPHQVDLKLNLLKQLFNFSNKIQ